MYFVDMNNNHGQMVLHNGVVVATHHWFIFGGRHDIVYFNRDMSEVLDVPENWELIAQYFGIDIESYSTWYHFYQTYGNPYSCSLVDSEYFD